jgi:hypothetical protein
VLVKVAVVKDGHNAKLGTEHLVNARPGALDEEFNNCLVLAQLLDIFGEDCLVKGVASKSAAHEECS